MRRSVLFVSVLSMSLLGAVACQKLRGQQQQPGESQLRAQVGPGADNPNTPPNQPNPMANDQQPVAGHDSMQDKLSDKLGADWNVSPSAAGNGYTATRNKAKKAGYGMSGKINREMGTLQKQDPSLNATSSGDEVTLGGRSDSCDDLIKRVNDFAKIDGVNRIVVQATCTAAH